MIIKINQVRSFQFYYKNILTVNPAIFKFIIVFNQTFKIENQRIDNLKHFVGCRLYKSEITLMNLKF